MNSPKFFKSTIGQLPLPVFFPDATRAVIKTIDSEDIKNTKTQGILVNTYHLFHQLGREVIKAHGGIRPFMNWDGAVISDSGGFQVMSVVKKSGKKNAITDAGISFAPKGGKKELFTPEKSIQFQMLLKTDMIVALDDFTPPRATRDQAKDTVERTIKWAKRSKAEFETECQKLKLSPNKRPYLLGVVQGGEYLDLRRNCAKRLIDIGFDGFGYGGWPINSEGKFNYEVAQNIVDNAPSDYLLYGLGVGKPHEIVALTKMGYHIFDCVLPTRDARHRRLYVYNADSIDKIDLSQSDFYSYYVPDKERYYKDTQPVSKACDCLLCTHYTRSYLAHLFRIEDVTALRLATIHNLRFYSLLMQKLQTTKP